MTKNLQDTYRALRRIELAYKVLAGDSISSEERKELAVTPSGSQLLNLTDVEGTFFNTIQRAEAQHASEEYRKEGETFKQMVTNLENSFF